MLDMASGFYFGLNSVASVIWQKMKECISFEALINQLIEEFQVERELCEKDTRELIDQLLVKNIIRIVE